MVLITAPLGFICVCVTVLAVLLDPNKLLNIFYYYCVRLLKQRFSRNTRGV